ncbi:MAG: hypothetical protein ICV68_15680, partial [Pyrinomonadaceae bacterium]|nr:hypothetical protein [Pyrinomonadaceae bacterium]
MRSFLKIVGLLLVGFLAGATVVSYYFNIPINLSPIITINFGSGDVDVDNDVRQGGQSIPTPSPETSTKTVTAPPSASKTEPPDTKTEPSQEARTSESGSAPDTATTPKISSQSAAVAKNYSERQHPRASFVSYPQLAPPRRRSCEPIMVSSADSSEEWEEGEGEYVQGSTPFTVRPALRGVVTSRSIVIHNGRVVSDRVVTRSYPEDD